MNLELILRLFEIEPFPLFVVRGVTDCAMICDFVNGSFGMLSFDYRSFKFALMQRI